MLQLRHHRKPNYTVCHRLTAVQPEPRRALAERSCLLRLCNFPICYSDFYIGPVILPTCSSSIAPEELVVVLTGEDVVTLLLPLTEPGPAACVVSYCDTPPGPAVVLMPGSLVVMFELPVLPGVVTVELLPPGVAAVTALLPEVLVVVLPVLLVLPPA